MTKSFTGACIYRLQEAGKLSLDDLIITHLPEARSSDPIVSSTATIADLLGHRTGLQKANNIWLGSEGEVLFTKEQTAAIFSLLKSQYSLRSSFSYHNIGYAILGEIISKVSGQPYHIFLQDTILDPLHMSKTLVTKDGILPDDMSLAYSVLENGEAYNVPLPGISASEAMGSAGGLMSTANDLSKYYKELLQAWHHRCQDTNVSGTSTYPSILRAMLSLSAPLQIMKNSALHEKSYAAGWARSQLPNTVGDIGVNPDLVEAMPVLGKGVPSRLALWHQGSLVGATSFVMLFPETQSAVLVLTNTMTKNDAADWIGQLLVETLLQNSTSYDFVSLAAMSADRASKKYEELQRKIESGRTEDGPQRKLHEYIGNYVGFGGVLNIKILEREGGLDILFQGRESQKFALTHHHRDTFTWFMTWDEQIKRARFISYQPSLYSVDFLSRWESSEGITALRWVHDGAMADGDIFIKES